jgi:hypothetical protein
MIGVCSGDDDDGNAGSYAPEEKRQFKPPQRAQAAPAPSNGDRPTAPESRGDAAAARTSNTSTSEALLCVAEGCNAALTPGQKTMAEKKYGVPLCPACQRKRELAAAR